MKVVSLYLEGDFGDLTYKLERIYPWSGKKAKNKRSPPKRVC
jgi:hypothetical protein